MSIDTLSKLYTIQEALVAYRNFTERMLDLAPKLSKEFRDKMTPQMLAINESLLEEARRIYAEDAKQKQTIKQQNP